MTLIRFEFLKSLLDKDFFNKLISPMIYVLLVSKICM